MGEQPKKVAKSSGRGSKPGERRGGRLPGVPNKATADVKAMALVHTPAAINELARLSTEAESEPARVAAIKELLDRAYGKARQMIDLDATVRLDWASKAEAARRISNGD